MLIGLFDSDALSTSLEPTIDFVVPPTVLVNVVSFNGAFLDNCALTSVALAFKDNLLSVSTFVYLSILSDLNRTLSQLLF